MVLEHNCRSTWTRPFRELRDAPLGARSQRSPPSTLRHTSCDIQMEFITSSSSGSRSIWIRWEDMMRPATEDPNNCVHLRNLGQSEWGQKLGKIECVFSLYDMMGWKWDDVYLLRGLPNIYSPSLCPPPLHMYHSTTTITPWRYTWRP